MSVTYCTNAEIIDMSREACACYACKGLHSLGGGHSIIDPDAPRMTPTSCVLNTLVKYYLDNPPAKPEAA